MFLHLLFYCLPRGRRDRHYWKSREGANCGAKPVIIQAPGEPLLDAESAMADERVSFIYLFICLNPLCLPASPTTILFLSSCRMITGLRPPLWSLVLQWTASLMKTWRGSLRTWRTLYLLTADVTSVQCLVPFWGFYLWSLLWLSWPSHSSFGGTHWTLVELHVKAFTFLWPSRSSFCLSPHGHCSFALPEPRCLVSLSSAVCCRCSSFSLWHLIGSSMGCGCWSPERRTTGGLWDMQHLWWTHCSSFSILLWCCWRSDTCSLLSVWKLFGPPMESAASITWDISG